MKIGVFGDSFGLPIPEAKKGKLWADHLRDFGYEVDNNCEAATSLYYTYNKYLQSRNLYDKVIFLVTHYKNMYVPGLKNYPHITDHDAVLRLLAKSEEKGFTEEEVEILKALDYHYKYIKNYNNYDAIEQDRTFHEALANSITDSNVLKIATFPDSMYNVNCSLHDIHMIDIDHYSIDDINTKYEDAKRSFVVNDLRHGHLNAENNVIVANKIKLWIEGGEFVFNKQDFTLPSDPLETYFNLV